MDCIAAVWFSAEEVRNGTLKLGEANFNEARDLISAEGCGLGVGMRLATSHWRLRSFSEGKE